MFLLWVFFGLFLFLVFIGIFHLACIRFCSKLHLLNGLWIFESERIYFFERLLTQLGWDRVVSSMNFTSTFFGVTRVVTSLSGVAATALAIVIESAPYFDFSEATWWIQGWIALLWLQICAAIFTGALPRPHTSMVVSTLGSFLIELCSYFSIMVLLPDICNWVGHQRSMLMLRFCNCQSCLAERTWIRVMKFQNICSLVDAVALFAIGRMRLSWFRIVILSNVSSSHSWTISTFLYLRLLIRIIILSVNCNSALISLVPMIWLFILSRGASYSVWAFWSWSCWISSNILFGCCHRIHTLLFMSFICSIDPSNIFAWLCLVIWPGFEVYYSHFAIGSFFRFIIITADGTLRILILVWVALLIK